MYRCFKSRTRDQQRGQAATVEMAILFPVFLVLLLGLVDSSRALYTYSTVSSAAREGARFGSIHPTWWTAPAAAEGTYGGQTEGYTTEAHTNPDPENIEARARRVTAGLEADRLTVETSLPDGNSSKGSRIRVGVVYRFRTIIPVFSNLRIASASTMRIE